MKINKNYKIGFETLKEIPQGYSSFQHSPQWDIEDDDLAWVEPNGYIQETWYETVHFFRSGHDFIFWITTSHGDVGNTTSFYFDEEKEELRMLK